jgi:hypothetical protein
MSNQVNAADVVAAFEQQKQATEALRVALEAFVAANAEYKIGDVIQADVGKMRSHAFRVNKIASKVDRDCVVVTYTGMRLKKDGSDHASAGGYGWQYIRLAKAAS